MLMGISMKECGEMMLLKELVISLLNSLGTFTYANSDRYEGEWKNGKKDGHGEINTKY